MKKRKKNIKGSVQSQIIFKIKLPFVNYKLNTGQVLKRSSISAVLQSQRDNTKLWVR